MIKMLSALMKKYTTCKNRWVMQQRDENFNNESKGNTRNQKKCNRNEEYL